MAYLTVQNVTKRFRRDVALADVSLSVERGETMAVFGPSGCGKTTLLRVIAGIHEPDQGSVILDGHRLDGLTPEHRDVGMAFQNFALYPHLSAFENIASPLRAHRVTGAEIRQRVGRVAELLRIGHVLDHLPRSLSNGQKQRTSLARSLVRAPSVVLLDDPLRNVDAKLRYEMRFELPRLLRSTDTTALYVTQDYKEAMAIGDRVAVLTDGRLVQIDTPETIYTEPANTDVARLFGDPTINLAEASAADGTLAAFGVRVPAPADGRHHLVGLRPEHIAISLEQVPGAVPMELDAVMPLNVRAILLLRTADGQELLASCSEDEAARFPRRHQAVWARIRPDDLLFFDPDSGVRRAAAAAATA